MCRGGGSTSGPTPVAASVVSIQCGYYMYTTRINGVEPCEVFYFDTPVHVFYAYDPTCYPLYLCYQCVYLVRFRGISVNFELIKSSAHEGAKYDTEHRKAIPWPPET